MREPGGGQVCQTLALEAQLHGVCGVDSLQTSEFLQKWLLLTSQEDPAGSSPLGNHAPLDPSGREEEGERRNPRAVPGDCSLAECAGPCAPDEGAPPTLVHTFHIDLG